MTDWKPGDRFNFPDGFDVVHVDSHGFVKILTDTWFNPADMARAVKLLPKARPVRKGDEIVSANREWWGEYRTYEGDFVVVVLGGRDRYLRIYSQRPAWTHVDGAPIDWEASE